MLFIFLAKTGGIDEPLQISFSKFLNLNFIFKIEHLCFSSRYVAKPKFPSENQKNQPQNVRFHGRAASSLWLWENNTFSFFKSVWKKKKLSKRISKFVAFVVKRQKSGLPILYFSGRPPPPHKFLNISGCHSSTSFWLWEKETRLFVWGMRLIDDS